MHATINTDGQWHYQWGAVLIQLAKNIHWVSLRDKYTAWCWGYHHGKVGMAPPVIESIVEWGERAVNQAVL